MGRNTDRVNRRRRELLAAAGALGLADMMQKRGPDEGFLGVRCEQCHTGTLVAFGCKKRGVCPSCGAQRMAETAALPTDAVLPERPLRQWVRSRPMALRFLLSTRPATLPRRVRLPPRRRSAHSRIP